MEFRVHSVLNNNIRKLSQWIVLILLVSGLGAMIPGVGSSETLYNRWSLPTSAYVITWILLAFLALIWLNLLFSPVGRSKVRLGANSAILLKGILPTEVDITSDIQGFERDFTLWTENPETESIWTIKMHGKKDINIVVPIQEANVIESVAKKWVGC